MAERQEENFEGKKEILKTSFTSSINESGGRFLKVKVATKTHILKCPDNISLVEEMVDSAKELQLQEGSTLNPKYVKYLLQGKANHYVIVYNRNKDKLKNEGKGISGFMIYDMELKDGTINCKIHCLLSVDSKKKIFNHLTEKVDRSAVKGCGTVALKDLEAFMKFMLRHFDLEKAWGGSILLDALPGVVEFYERDGHVI